MNVFELTSIYRKSFYGKCKVLEANTGIYKLYSYETEVATYNKETGKWWNTKNEYHLTDTTLRHIKAFQNFLGLKLQNKAQLLKNELYKNNIKMELSTKVINSVLDKEQIKSLQTAYSESTDLYNTDKEVKEKLKTFLSDNLDYEVQDFYIDNLYNIIKYELM